MSSRDRAMKAARDIGLGGGTVAVLLVLTWWGSVDAVLAVFVVLSLVALWWVATTGVDRLRGAAGWPRPLLFGGAILLLAANASVYSVTGFTALLLSAGVLAVAVFVGLVRVLSQTSDLS